MKSPSSYNIFNKRGFVIFLLFNLFIISHHSPDIPNEFYFQSHMSSRLDEGKAFCVGGKVLVLTKDHLKG